MAQIISPLCSSYTRAHTLCVTQNLCVFRNFENILETIKPLIVSTTDLIYGAECPSCVTASGVATSSLTPDTDIAPAPCLKTLAAGIRVISSSNVQLCTLCCVMQADLCALACVHRAPTAQLPCVRNFAFVSSVQHLSPAPH